MLGVGSALAGGGIPNTTDLFDVKQSVRCATTTTLPANTYNNAAGTLTGNANGAFAAVDGITMVLNEDIFVKNEATGANNGIYKLTTVGTAGTPYVLTRRTDADSSAKMTTGMMVWVSEGTVNADTFWALTTNDAITLGTTALSFTQESGPGAFLPLTGGTLTGTLTLPAGSVTAPSLVATGAPAQSGLYWVTAGSYGGWHTTVAGLDCGYIGIDSGGFYIWAVGGSGTTGAMGAAAQPALCRQGDRNTGLWFPDVDIIASTAGGVEGWRQTATANTFALAVTPSAGIGTATTAITAATVPCFAGGAAPETLTGGTDTAMANGSSWFAPVYVPVNCTLTGVGYNIGSVGGTDKVVVALYTASGQLAALANSDTAGTLVGTANTMQEVAFTGTYAAKNGWYWILIQANGATAKLRLSLATGQRGGTVVGGTFGTLPATLTLPTTNVAAPICYVY